MIKLKTTEEMEMECIAKLRQQTKRHIRANERLMKKAMSCPKANTVRAANTTLTRPQEFHFQTDKRVKQHPMTTRADHQEPDVNGDDAEKGFWNSLRQHPPSPVSTGTVVVLDAKLDKSQLSLFYSPRARKKVISRDSLTEAREKKSFYRRWIPTHPFHGVQLKNKYNRIRSIFENIFELHLTKTKSSNLPS